MVQDSVDEDIYELGVKKSMFSETVLASTTDGKPSGMPDEKVRAAIKKFMSFMLMILFVYIRN